MIMNMTQKKIKIEPRVNWTTTYISVSTYLHGLFMGFDFSLENKLYFLKSE